MDSKRKLTPQHIQIEQMVKNAIGITEMCIEMKEKCQQGDKYASYLRSIALRATKNISNLLNTSQQFLIIAHKMLSTSIKLINEQNASPKEPLSSSAIYATKMDCEKLLTIIKRELADEQLLDEKEQSNMQSDCEQVKASITERIKCLEAKQRGDGGDVQQTCSVRSVKSDVDEKYPENWSRDSLIDLNNVVNLPPVPEDIFTCFTHKPSITRTSSLSSLKGMRKVKLFLQRAANNSDEEADSSDLEEHDVIGDNEDKFNSSSKKLLGNIKEEQHQQD